MAMTSQQRSFLALLSFIVIVLILGLLINFIFTAKGIKITSPAETVEWKTGQTYKISWRANKIEKVGIVLFKNDSPQWIVKDLPGGQKGFDWNIFEFQEPSSDYKIAIFEYPWKEGNKIAYTREKITIMGPKFASCDALSIPGEWPFVPSDYTNIKRVFISSGMWKGNLGGFDGADQKCQEEAVQRGFGGNWIALLGGDRISAQERLKSDGVFVIAEPSALLPGGKSCHRLLGNNFSALLEKFSFPGFLVQTMLGEESVRKWGEIWLGRLLPSTKKECLFLKTDSKMTPLNFSFTVSCQNWLVEQDSVYTQQPGVKIKAGELPKCYTPLGKLIDAAGFGGLSSGLSTDKPLIQNSFTPSGVRYCNIGARLLCIEQ